MSILSSKSVKIAGSVAVITGASSGIGKAAALEFARRGASVVLAARRSEALEAAAAECRALGARALAVPTDTAEEGSVRELARRAVDAFGKVDIWVNNAAVGAAGAVESVPMEAYRRTMETNFFGYLHGARAVLPIFRKQGRGVLINNASMVSKIPEPYFSAYVASKQAVRGFAQCLRQELSLEGAREVHVCTLMPAAIDTPFFQHSANYSGRALKPPPPVYPAERVARAMADCAECPRREFFVGGSARMFHLLFLVSSVLAERLVARIIDRTHFERRSSIPERDGSLFAPVAEGTDISGGWTPLTGRQAKTRGREAGAGGRRTLRTGWKAAAAALALIAGALALAARPKTRLRAIF